MGSANPLEIPEWTQSAMLDTAELIIKSATIALLSFQTVQLLIRGHRIPAAWPAMGFILSLICYIVCTMTGPIRPIPLWKYPVIVGCLGVPFFFWLLSLALFDDHFRPRAVHWLIFVLVEAYTFSKLLDFPSSLYAYISASPVLTVILRPFPQVFSLIFVMHALGLAYLGIKSDLLEGRRRFRVVFIVAIGIYAIIVLLFEVMLKDRGVPGMLEFVHAIVFLLLTFAIVLRLNTLEEGILFSKPAGKKAPTESADAPEMDTVLNEKLRTRLVDEKVFQTEGITVQSLAMSLEIPEYKLRRHINQSLGYRNFNDFLNRYRVEEAQRILRDPDYDDRAILRIAMDLGYGSLAPFNRAFRRITGMTPSRFRRASSSQ